MDFEAMLEKELESNAELKKVFEEHPERRALYLEKLRDTWDSKTGSAQPKANQKAKCCQDCIFSHGEAPFADSPNKAYCEMYPKGMSSGKPHDVYFNGAFCELYEKE